MNSRFERTIDIKKLCISILGHWRCILACILIGMGILVLTLGIRSTDQVKEEENVDEVVKLDELDEESQESIQNLLSYEKALKQKEDYFENSILMNLDANAISKGKLTLYIKSAADGQADLAANMIGILLSNGSGVSELSSQFKRYSVDQLKEILKVNLFVQKEIGKSEEKGAIIDITVIGSDSESCSELLNKISEYIEGKKVEMSSQFGDFEISELDRNFYMDVDEDIQTQQNKAHNEIVSLEIEIKNRIEALTEDELKYYNKISGIEEETEEEIKDSDSDSKTGFLKYIKYAFLGGILGGFICIFVFGVRYVFDGYIKEDDDIEEIFGIWDIQNLRVPVIENKKSRFLDRWLISKKDHNNLVVDEAVEEAETKLTGILNSGEISKIVICGEEIDESKMKIIEKLGCRLKEQGIETVITNKVFDEIYHIKKGAGVSHAVIVGEIAGTSYEKFSKEIRVLERQAVNIIGAITV